MYLHLIHKDFFCLIHSNPVAGMNWSSRWVTHNTRVAFYIPRKRHKALPERGALQRMHCKLPRDCRGPGGCPITESDLGNTWGNVGFSGDQWHLFVSHPKHVRPSSAEVTAENICDVLGPCCVFPVLLHTICRGKDWLKKNRLKEKQNENVLI